MILAEYPCSLQRAGIGRVRTAEQSGIVAGDSAGDFAQARAVLAVFVEDAIAMVFAAERWGLALINSSTRSAILCAGSRS